MILWEFIRVCFLWMPFELYMLCAVVFTVFAFLFVLRLLKTIWDALPWV